MYLFIDGRLISATAFPDPLIGTIIIFVYVGFEPEFNSNWGRSGNQGDP